MKQKTKFKQTAIGLIPKDWNVDYFEQQHLKNKNKTDWKRLQISEYANTIIANELQIKENNVVCSDYAHITNTHYKKSPDIMLRKDRLMTKYRTKNKVEYAKKPPNKNITSLHIHLQRKQLHTLFVFYFFKSSKFQNTIKNKITSSFMPRLKDTNSTVSSMQEQQIIAKFLADFYSKIELNHKMNQTLDTISQSISKHLFCVPKVLDA